jgi:hypothetical protein
MYSRAVTALGWREVDPVTDVAEKCMGHRGSDIVAIGLLFLSRNFRWRHMLITVEALIGSPISRSYSKLV